jgi:DNA-3-methyladenine glycosylase II
VLSVSLGSDLDTVQDLAGRFADGRLSTEKLLNSTDEELAEMLIQVKGIGRVGVRFSGSYHILT